MKRERRIFDNDGLVFTKETDPFIHHLKNRINLRTAQIESSQVEKRMKDSAKIDLIKLQKQLAEAESKYD